MSNFRKWKTARRAFAKAEDDYNAAYNACILAREKRRDAYIGLTSIAGKLSISEQKEATDYEYVPALPSKDGGGHG